MKEKKNLTDEFFFFSCNRTFKYWKYAYALENRSHIFI